MSLRRCLLFIMTFVFSAKNPQISVQLGLHSTLSVETQLKSGEGFSLHDRSRKLNSRSGVGSHWQPAAHLEGLWQVLKPTMTVS